MKYCLPSSYPLAFFWGLAVIFGMIGLGRVAGRLIDSETSKDAGWGLHAVWGMTVYLMMGSILALCHLCGATAITVIVSLGVVAMLWTSIRDWSATRAALTSISWKLWPAFAVAALLYCGGILYWGRANPCDDWPCYFYFCEKLLWTGSFDEPFSWRRMASLGGHTLLQDSVVARTSLASADAFEMAIGPIFLFGLIAGFRRGVLGKSLLGVLIAFIAVTTPLMRLNSASQMTGVLFFVGLFITLVWIDEIGVQNPKARLRWLIAVGLIAAECSSLRAQYVPATGGALGLFWLATWIRDRRPRREMMIELACFSGAMLLGMLPWMVMSYRSNETPLFPLFQANTRLDFNSPRLHATFLQRCSLPERMLIYPEIYPLLLCLLALPSWRRALPARALVFAMVVASFMVAFSFPLASDEESIPRYVQPLLFAGALAALLSAATLPRTRLHAWALALLLLALTASSRHDFLFQKFAILQQSAINNIPYTPTQFFDHRHAQEAVPAGKRVLVCSDYPMLFDFKRNPLWIVDMPNSTSPAPGMPFRKSPAEMKRYLQGLGVDYLIYVDFSKSVQLYSRPMWEEHARNDVPLWKIQSELYLDFFDTVDRLAVSEKQLGKFGDLTVLQISP